MIKFVTFEGQTYDIPTESQANATVEQVKGFLARQNPAAANATAVQEGDTLILTIASGTKG